MVEVLTNLGDRLTKSEARKLVANADVTGDGRIDYRGRYRIDMTMTRLPVNRDKLGNLI